ncbi:nuclear LIM factor interactor-interacting protein hyphal form [Achlya hypogyna]|uniref:Nuclear LIM factor interactor-interacting protein hyphal form n=1 Tax=Achlya hypogyna TaxID=1202772 RepID=A0A1V9YNB6_ACHHY|nr:nuclear LIM factor interactor-interacting protein hyphal form [Achlya hypogyna]
MAIEGESAPLVTVTTKSKPPKRAATGYYADPCSPIASTPLKRQRLDSAPATPSLANEPCSRRLEMDSEDSDSDDVEGSPKADLFSPTLKVEKKTARVQPVVEEAPVEEVADDTSTDEVAVEMEFNPFYFMKTLPRYEDVADFVRPVALPKKDPTAPNVCLVLDLDETLVHCSVDDMADADLKFPIDYNGTEYMVSVKKRPFMTEFLAQVSEWFEVVVFTASQRVYAEKLLNLLDPCKQYITHRLYRENCLPVEGNYLKDLNVLGRDLRRVLLIDNSPHAFGYQVNNGIPIESWFSDDGDDELLKLLPFLQSLVHAEDVRPIVANQFQIQRLIDAAQMDDAEEAPGDEAPRATVAATS